MAFANVIRTQYILPRKMDDLFIVSLFGGAIVNMMINRILIPYYGALGAAIGTLVAEIVVCAIQSMVVIKKVQIGKVAKKSSVYILSGILMFTIFRNYTPCANMNPFVSLMTKICMCGGFYLGSVACMLLLYQFMTKIGFTSK